MFTLLLAILGLGSMADRVGVVVATIDHETGSRLACIPWLK